MTDPVREDNMLGLVDEYAHGLLGERDRSYVAQRIGESRVWAAAYEDAKRRRDLLESVPAAEPGDELIGSTLAAISDRGPLRARRRRLAIGIPVAAIAALIALFVGANIYFANLSPSPYSLQIVGQQTLMSGSQGSLRIRLAGTEEGVVISDRDVSLSLHNDATGDSVELASFETDEHGTGSPRFQIPDWEDGEYRLTVSARTPEGTERIEQTVRLRRESRLIVSTDKPLYQPGQTIHARVHALHRGSGLPLARKPVTFEIADPKGTLIFRERTVSSAFGIASAECPIATLINEGDYTLRCRVGEVESTRSIRIDRYTLPKFGATVGMDRSFYGPGDVIRGTIDARYFFGKPVATGSAEIVSTTEIAGKAHRFSSITLDLDESGASRFSVRLPDRLFGTLNNEGDADITIAVRITDPAGQTVERSVRRIVTSNPLKVHAVPENGRPIPGIPSRCFVFTTLADGSPTEARVSVEGLDQELVTNGNGIASFTIDRVTDDGISLAIRAVDGQGRVARNTLALEPDTADRAFVFRTDSTSYDAGGTMSISAFGGGGEPVFIDLIRDGQTILTDRIPFENGKGVHAIDLPTDIAGSLRLVAYRFDENGWPIRRDRVVVVRPASDLRIKVDGAEQPYRPGDRATLRVSVTDAEGAPAPGALSLSIVDEAVFNVRGDGSPLTRAFDSLETELLDPIYAVYPWDPFAAGKDDALLADAIGALGSVSEPNARDQRLRRLLDKGYIDESMIEVLQSDRLDDLIEWMGDAFTEQTLAFLRGDNSDVYTMRAATYPVKVRETERAKRAWKKTRDGILATAGFLGGIAFLGLLIYAVCRAIGLSRTGIVEYGVVLVIILLLIGVMLPALGKARASARRLSDASSLRSLGYALEMDEEHIPADPEQQPGASATPCLREWFPETLLWRPELITDDEGVASIDPTLADSITNWKISSAAITADGQLGSATSDLTVFQPFFIDIDAPVALTRGDVIEFPVVLYNYLDEEQAVEITLDREPWYDLLGEPTRTITMDAGDVLRTTFRMRATEVGLHAIRIDATGTSARGGVSSDAIRKEIRVEPEGMPVLRAVNGTLRNPATLSVAFPADAVPDSTQAILKLYPSPFSQVLEGLDGIFARPYGCFEQTSSTTYPNILALDYLRRTSTNAPQTEARALQYIHLGYQRLLSFEVDGGGFDWFGNPPANRTLTAYGLMEFEDMARVRDVDPALLTRTRNWLLDQQAADGSWAPESHEMHDGPTAQDPEKARLVTTAYITWAAFNGSSVVSNEALAARRYLLQTSPDKIDDPYTLALVALALLSTGAEENAGPYLSRLAGLRTADPDGTTRWQRPGRSRTMFYGAGPAADIEATSLAILAFITSGSEPGLTRATLEWLTEQRDPHGTWGTTQSTVLALKALVGASDAPLGGGAERRVEIRQGGTLLREVVVPSDQADVMQMIDLSAIPGFNSESPIEISDRTDTATGYQLALRHHVNSTGTPGTGGLSIDVEYDRTSLRVGETISATARVRNATPSTKPMVMLDLPIPPGFEPDPQDFRRLVVRGTIAKFEITPRSIIVYLRQIEPGTRGEIRYTLRATMPVEVQTPSPRAYEYYNPEIDARGESARLTVSS